LIINEGLVETKPKFKYYGISLFEMSQNLLKSCLNTTVNGKMKKDLVETKSRLNPYTCYSRNTKNWSKSIVIIFCEY